MVVAIQNLASRVQLGCTFQAEPAQDRAYLLVPRIQVLGKFYVSIRLRTGS